jgi:hypothetical protein
MVRDRLAVAIALVQMPPEGIGFSMSYVMIVQMNLPIGSHRGHRRLVTWSIYVHRMGLTA